MGPNPKTQREQEMRDQLFDDKTIFLLVQGRLMKQDPIDRDTLREVEESIKKIDELIHGKEMQGRRHANKRSEI